MASGNPWAVVSERPVGGKDGGWAVVSESRTLPPQARLLPPAVRKAMAAARAGVGSEIPQGTLSEGVAPAVRDPRVHYPGEFPSHTAPPEVVARVAAPQQPLGPELPPLPPPESPEYAFEVARRVLPDVAAAVQEVSDPSLIGQLDAFADAVAPQVTHLAKEPYMLHPDIFPGVIAAELLGGPTGIAEEIAKQAAPPEIPPTPIEEVLANDPRANIMKAELRRSRQERSREAQGPRPGVVEVLSGLSPERIAENIADARYGQLAGETVVPIAMLGHMGRGYVRRARGAGAPQGEVRGSEAVPESRVGERRNPANAATRDRIDATDLRIAQLKDQLRRETNAEVRGDIEQAIQRENAVLGEARVQAKEWSVLDDAPPRFAPETAQPEAFTPEAAARDTALFRQSREELGAKATDSEVLRRAQELKQNPTGVVATPAHPLQREAIGYLEGIDRIKGKQKRAKGAENLSDNAWLGETDSILRRAFKDEGQSGELFGDYLRRISGRGDLKPKSVPFREDYPALSGRPEDLPRSVQRKLGLQRKTVVPAPPQSGLSVKHAAKIRAGKQDWEIPREVYVTGKWGQGTAEARGRNHRLEVERALRDGKPVPEEVLRDYPDLVNTPAQKTLIPLPPSVRKQAKSGPEAGFIRLGAPEKPADAAATPRLEAIRKAQRRPRPVFGDVIHSIKRFPKNLQRSLYDRFVDVRDAVKDMRKRGLEFDATEDPGVVLDIVYGGTGGKLQAEAIEMHRVIRSADKAGLLGATQDYLNLAGYRRAINIIKERAAGTSDASALAAYNLKLQEGGIVPQYKNVAEIEADMLAMRQKLGIRNYNQAKRFAQQIFDMNQRAWKLAYESGIISKEVFDQGVRRGSEYIPLERIMDVVEETRRTTLNAMDLKQQRILQKLEGSERVNRDPFSASLNRIFETIREVERNRAAKTLVTALLRDKEGFAAQVRRLEPDETIPHGASTISYYSSGRKVTHVVPKLLGDALNTANVQEMVPLGNAVLRLTRSIFRTGATGANLTFTMRNVPRDQQDAFQLSKLGGSPKTIAEFEVKFAKAIKSVLAKDEAYLEFLRSGASFSTLQKRIDPTKFLSVEKPGPLARANVPGRVLRTVEEINNAFEEATKIAFYQMLRERGMPEAQAVIETRRFGGSPDFARRGTHSRAVDLAFMFFNANVQGIGRTIERRGGIFINPKTVAGATAASLALYSHNQQFVNEDGTREWDRVSENDKQKYWVILLPETYQTERGAIRHRMWKIPKGHAAQIVFNPIESGVDQAVTGKFEPGKIALDAVESALPGNFRLKQKTVIPSLAQGVVASANPILREPIEQIAGAGGIDTFRQVPIVPRGLQEVEPSQQRTVTTSPTAAKIAEKLNASPLRVEHAIRGIFAGLGEQGLELADLFQPKRKGTEILEGDEAIARKPVVGLFARTFVGSPIDQKERQEEERFYEHYDKANKARRTFRNLANDSSTKAERFLAEGENEVYANAQPALLKGTTLLTQIRRAMVRVAESDLPVEERRKAIRDLREQRMEVLKLSDEIESLLGGSRE